MVYRAISTSSPNSFTPLVLISPLHILGYNISYIRERQGHVSMVGACYAAPALIRIQNLTHKLIIINAFGFVNACLLESSRHPG